MTYEFITLYVAICGNINKQYMVKSENQKVVKYVAVCVLLDYTTFSPDVSAVSAMRMRSVRGVAM